MCLESFVEVSTDDPELVCGPTRNKEISFMYLNVADAVSKPGPIIGFV